MPDPADLLTHEVFDVLPEACALIGRGGRIVRVNAAFARLLGGPAGDFAGLAFERLYADPLDSHLAPWKPAAAHGRAQRARLEGPAGERIEAEIKAAPLEVDAARFVVVVRARSGKAAADDDHAAGPVEGAYSFNFETGTGLLSGALEVLATGQRGTGRMCAYRWLGLIDDEARTRILEQLRSTRHDPHHLHRFTCPMRGGDGVMRLFDHQLRVFARGRRGQPLRVSGIARERTALAAAGGTQARYALALEAGELCGWDYDFAADIGACSGPVPARPSIGGAPTFTLQDWRSRLHPDDADRAIAAFAGLEFSGTMDVTYRVYDGQGSWRLHHTRAAPDAGRGRAYGYTRVMGLSDVRPLDTPGDVELVNLETARSVRGAALTTWTRDVETGILTIRGPLTERFGLVGLGGGALQLPLSAWFERIHPDDRDRFDLESQSHVRSAAGGEIEYRMLDADNRYVRLRVRGGISEQGADGRPLALSGVLIDVDESEELRRRLAETETRLEEAVKATQLCVWSYDFRRRRFCLSGTVLDSLGFESGEGEGLGAIEISADEWRERIHGDDVARFVEAIGRAEVEDTVEVEYRVRDGEGAYRWLNVRGGTTERDAAGAALRSSGFFIDVTERRELEGQLAQRERQLADAVEAGLVGIWSINHRTGERHARGQILRWMGKALDDTAITREDWTAILHHDDVEATVAMQRSLLEGRDIGSVDLRIKSPRGWRWVRTEGRPLERDGEGRAVRSAGVMLDVSAELAYASAVQREKTRLDTIYQMTPGLFHTIDPNGLTTRVNAHWVERLGYGEDEAVGQSGLIAIHPDDRERMLTELIPHTFADGRLVREPVRLLTKSGELIEARLSAFVEQDEQGQPIAAHGVFEDVTDIHRATRELEGYAEELERTNRELNRFATVASHDLQEPLRKIAAFSSLLRRRYQGRLDPEADRSLDFLVDAAGRMRTLIDDLLTYSRASSRPLDHVSVDLERIARDAVTGLDIVIAESEARIEIGPLPSVEGDPMLLNLLFQNLISNAIKYRGSAAPEISVTAGRIDDVWTVCVADNGIGMEAKFFEKIFAPFQRLHGREDYAGTGIGLAICQQAVERHGGRIWLESEPGTGSRFYFTLPAGESRDEAA